MRLSTIPVVLGWLGLQAAAQAAGVNITSLYGPGLSQGAEIFYASDPEFSEEIPHRWTVYHAPTFYAAIKPSTEADVQHIVRISVENDIPFLATGAGHGGTITLGRFQDGVEIDLSGFKTVELQDDNTRIVVGGGTVYSDLYEPMFNAGKMMAMGSSPCVGVLGAGLGGAVGLWQGLYGLGIDSLESVRLVTATGDLITVSETEHPDLFWGIRGAGCSFGIVTSATFRLHDAVNGGIVASNIFLYPGKHNESVWEALASFDDEIPDELAITMTSSFNRTTLEPTIMALVSYYGTPLQAARYLRPFKEAGPLLDLPLYIPWTKLQSLSLLGDPTACTSGHYVSDYSMALKRTDVATFTSYFNDLTSFWRDHPTYAGVFVVERYPEAVTRRVPDEETAYPHREAKIQVLLENFYPDSSLDDRVNEFMRAARAQFQETSGFDQLSVYVNFAQGDEGVDAWYSPRKMGRLTQLKRTWDPNELFSYNNPVPLQYP